MNYIGHESMVPEEGDYFATEHYILSRIGGGIRCHLNKCPHRGSILVPPGTKTKGFAVKCPAHGWVIDLANKPPLSMVHSMGLIFGGEAPYIVRGMSPYVFDHQTRTTYQGRWETFMEVYCETLHVPVIHDKLGAIADVSTAVTQCWDHGAYQVLPNCDVAWYVHFPFFMMEWYPGFGVISYLIRQTPLSYLNVVEYYFPPLTSETERMKAIDLYETTAAEDYVLCQNLEAGRGLDTYPVYPKYKSPEDDMLEHFHKWGMKNVAVLV